MSFEYKFFPYSFNGYVKVPMNDVGNVYIPIGGNGMIHYESNLSIKRDQPKLSKLEEDRRRRANIGNEDQITEYEFDYIMETYKGIEEVSRALHKYRLNGVDIEYRIDTVIIDNNSVESRSISNLINLLNCIKSKAIIDSSEEKTISKEECESIIKEHIIEVDDSCRIIEDRCIWNDMDIRYNENKKGAIIYNRHGAVNYSIFHSKEYLIGFIETIKENNKEKPKSI